MALKVYLKSLLIVLFYAIDFLLADKPFAKALRNLKICVLVKNNFCGKLVSSLEPPTTFDQSFKVTSVRFFIPDFNLLICKLYYSKINSQFHNTSTVLCEKSEKFSFASLIKNNIFPPCAKFPAKLVCCIDFGSASSSRC